MLEYIIGAIVLLIIWIVLLISSAKRESDYWDWLGNYNLPEDLKNGKNKKA